MTDGTIDASPQGLHRSDPREPPSPSTSLASAPSSTQTLAHFSSPELPPPPSLPRLAGLPSTPSQLSPPPKTDTSYYTASWGSPYPASPYPASPQESGSSSGKPRERGRDWSDDLEYESPDPKFGLGHLLPSRIPFLQLDVTPTRPSSPASDKSSEPALPSVSRARWFSPTRSRAHKNSNSVGESPLPQSEGRLANQTSWWNNASRSAKPLFNRHQSQEINEFKLGNFDGDDNFVVTDSDSAASDSEAFQKGHKSRGNNPTLTQADFWPAIKSFRDSISNMYQSRWAVHGPKSPDQPKPSVTAEKPSVAESMMGPTSPTPELPTPAFDLASPPPVERKNSTTSVTSRPKKKIVYKNKNIVIALPAAPPRRDNSEFPFPLSPPELAARLRQFELQGYDVRGFDKWNGGEGLFDSVNHASNRSVFPDETEQVQIFRQRQFSVRLPDTKTWDAHVRKVVDDKLRALGVSPAGEEPVPAVMSRQASSQPSSVQPFSPPPRASSAGNQFPGLYPGSAFPPGFIPGSSNHTSRASVASPISSIENRRESWHMHRQSMFSPAGMHSQIQQQMMGPPSVRSWSPQQIISPPGLVKSGSPALSNSRQDFSRQSPITPFHGQQPSQQFPFAQREELLAQMQRQQQQQQQALQLQLQHQQQQILAAQQAQQVRPASTLKEVPEVEEELDRPLHRSPDRVTEIANPKPSHRHNISVKLEQDIHSAHYHLEDTINRELDDEDGFDTAFKPVAAPLGHNAVANGASNRDQKSETNRKAGYMPKSAVEGSGRSLAAEIEHQKDGSDILTNPSDTEDKARFDNATTKEQDEARAPLLDNPWAKDSTFTSKPTDAQHPRRSSHTSKASMSGLNVEAKEFNPRANPHAAFNPAIFSGSSFTSQPSAAAKPFVPRSVNQTEQSSAKTTPSLSATAPVFSPNFGTTGSNGPRDFSFTSKRPPFKPTAPTFSPTSSSDLDRSFDATGSDSSNLIFKNIDLAHADVSKPMRKNRALPIVVPKSSPQPEPQYAEEEFVDENRRIIQSDTSRKKARHGGDGGDEVPRFATPSSPPSLASQHQLGWLSEQQSSPLEEVKNAGSLDVRLSPTAQLQESSEEITVGPDEVAAVKESQGQNEIVVEEEASSPEEPEEIEVVEVEVITEPTPPAKEDKRSRWPIILPDDDVPEPRPERVSPVPQAEEPRNSSSLSALAAPFEFKRQEPEPVKSENIHDISPHSTRPHHGEGVKESQTVEPIVSPLSSEPSSPTEVEIGNEEESHRTERHVLSSVRYYNELEQPSFQEIDAVMQHFNEEGSDAGVERVEREEPSWPASSPRVASITPGRLAEYTKGLEAKLRSDAPSPSPRRLFGPPATMECESSTQDPFSDGRAALAYESPVRRLDSAGRRPVSDWDDVVSSGENEQFQERAGFFDRRVSGLVEDAVRARLSPVEKRLAQIQTSLAGFTGPDLSRRVRSRGTNQSDADDEDDDDDQATDYHSRNYSPRRDPKMEKIRQIIVDALSTQRVGTSSPLDRQDFSELYDVMADIKTSVLNSVSQIIQPDDVRQIMDETVARQNEELIRVREEANKHQDDARIAEFSHALEEANAQLTVETEARKAAERRAQEDQRLLKLTEEELELHKKALQDGGQASKVAEVELVALKETLSSVEAERDELQKSSRQTATELREKNEALNATIEEYRISSDKWRRDLQRAAEEKETMQKSSQALRIQAEETIRIKESMRARIEKLHEDSTAAAGQIAMERSQWQRADAEHRTRYEVLKARAEAEARTRERLEKELDRLEAQEREFMRSRAILEHSQKENARLEELAKSLRHENSALQKSSDQHVREASYAKEHGHAEAQRTRTVLEAQLESASRQTSLIRAELESEITRANAEVQRMKQDADAIKAKLELELKQAADAKRAAVQEVVESKAGLLQEQRRSFEERLEELRKQHRRDLDHVIENKNQAESFLKEAHAERLHELEQRYGREVEQTLDEKRRSEEFLNDRLGLADEKIDYLQDKVLHLEEKLEIAKSAAHAAALAAKSAKAPALEQPPTPVRSTIQPGGGVNAQALRETIAVLQDQLQEREGRIDRLENEMSELDIDAPAKIKARDTEIGWLRELLAVRLDDLGDVVNALAKPDFDREAVRNAAIRIRAGLQMEQHDKERQLSGSQSFPTLASISNFASPRAAQIAAAWGNWRKGRDLLPSSLSHSVSAAPGGTPHAQTPSKPQTTAQSFLSGLMTPPTSNLRRTPSPTNLLAGSSSSISMPLDSAPDGSIHHPLLPRNISHDSSTTTTTTTGATPTSSGGRTPQRRLEKQPAVLQPSTPPLLRQASYDRDAAETDDADFSTAGFYDDDESTVDLEGTPRGIVGRRRRSTGAGSASGGRGRFGQAGPPTGSPVAERFANFA